MNLYLDIDGVLVGREGMLPNKLGEFLEHVTTKHQCFWLTTHCQGDTLKVKQHLQKFFPQELMSYIDLIKPTVWPKIKTDGIDFTKDFIWLDDYIFESDWQVLERHKKQDSAILIDIKENPTELWDLVGVIL